jgi:ElaB/YqjD/DUF883 family membrane-anchored ribosome-binding protein
MLETITRNPIPAVLVGLGMYWLLKNPSERTGGGQGDHSLQYRPQEYGMTPGETSLEGKMKEGFQSVKNQIQEHVTNWKDQAGQQAQQWKEQASQKAHQWKEETGQKKEEVKGYLQEQSRAARHKFNSFHENNPLAMGAVMVAVGAAVAAGLHGSRREDQ